MIDCQPDIYYPQQTNISNYRSSFNYEHYTIPYKKLGKSYGKKIDGLILHPLLVCLFLFSKLLLLLYLEMSCWATYIAYSCYNASETLLIEFLF